MLSGTMTGRIAQPKKSHSKSDDLELPVIHNALVHLQLHTSVQLMEGFSLVSILNVCMIGTKRKWVHTH